MFTRLFKGSFIAGVAIIIDGALQANVAWDQTDRQKSITLHKLQVALQGRAEDIVVGNVDLEAKLPLCLEALKEWSLRLSKFQGRQSASCKRATCQLKANFKHTFSSDTHVATNALHVGSSASVQADIGTSSGLHKTFIPLASMTSRIASGVKDGNEVIF